MRTFGLAIACYSAALATALVALWRGGLAGGLLAWVGSALLTCVGAVAAALDAPRREQPAPTAPAEPVPTAA